MIVININQSHLNCSIVLIAIGDGIDANSLVGFVKFKFSNNVNEIPIPVDDLKLCALQ